MVTLEAIDQGAVHAIHNYAHFPVLTQVMVALVWLGSPYVVAGLTLLAAGFLMAYKLRRQALLLLIAVGLAFALSYGTKAVVNRPWPNVGWRPVRSVEPAPAMRAKSFPNTNALAATALFGSLALMLGRRAGCSRLRGTLHAGGVVLPFLAGASCLYAGHNYLSDVLAGWTAGAALAMLCGWMDERSAITV